MVGCIEAPLEIYQSYQMYQSYEITIADSGKCVKIYIHWTMALQSLICVLSRLTKQAAHVMLSLLFSCSIFLSLEEGGTPMHYCYRLNNQFAACLPLKHRQCGI